MNVSVKSNPVVVLVIIVTWVAGIVLAKGFWSTTFALFIPLWAWYLVVERGLQAIGWV